MRHRNNELCIVAMLVMICAKMLNINKVKTYNLTQGFGNRKMKVIFFYFGSFKILGKRMFMNKF